MDPPVQGYGDNIQFLRTLADYWTNKVHADSTGSTTREFTNRVREILSQLLHYMHYLSTGDFMKKVPPATRIFSKVYRNVKKNR